MRRLKNRGDTIVEVLIAITVVTTVLGGAFVSSNRSLTVTRQAQERGEALKLAEGQLELLKSAGRTASNPVYTATTDFCMSSGSPGVSVPSGDPVCTISPASSGAVYRLRITGSGPPSSNNSFTIEVLWEKAGGSGDDRLSLAYQMYEPS